VAPSAFSCDFRFRSIRPRLFPLPNQHREGEGGSLLGLGVCFSSLFFFVMVCAVVCVSSVAPRPSLPPYCGCGVSCVGIKIEALIGGELISFRASLHPY